MDHSNHGPDREVEGEKGGWEGISQENLKYDWPSTDDNHEGEKEATSEE